MQLTRTTLAWIATQSLVGVHACFAQCSTFAPLGTGINAPVRALCAWAPTPGASERLVAGGLFTAHDQFPCDYVGYWDGATWRALGWGTDGAVNAVTTWDPDGNGPLPKQVIAAGAFLYAGADSTGPTLVNRIARWDGTAWRAMGAGLDGPVSCLTTWDPDGPGPQSALLIAGGSFTHANGVLTGSIAAWNGTAWRALGWGLGGGAVRSMTTWDADGDGPLLSRLAVAGSFTFAGSDSTGQVAVSRAALWNNSVWSDAPALWDSATMLEYDFDGSGPRTPELVSANWQINRSSSTLTSIMPWYEYEVAAGNCWGTDFPGSFATWDIDGAGPLAPQLFIAGAFRRDCQEEWYKGCESHGCISTRTFNVVMRWEGGGWTSESDGSTPANVLATWDPDGPGLGGAWLAAGGDIAPFLEVRGGFSFPSIIRQPESASVTTGGSATFTVESSTPRLSYRWSKITRYPIGPGDYVGPELLTNGVLATGTMVSGAGTSTLTLSGLSTRDTLYNGPSYILTDTFIYCDISDGCGTTRSAVVKLRVSPCTADFNRDGDIGTDADIEAFFQCLAGHCCPSCDLLDLDESGDSGTDADIEAFFRVLAGGNC